MKTLISALAALAFVAGPAFAETSNTHVKHPKQARYAHAQQLKEGRYSAVDRDPKAHLIEQGYSDYFPAGPGIFQ
jgi:hypothetical protein